MAVGSLARDIKTFACKYTGVSINYKKTTKWFDDSAMNDLKADGTIYRKLGSEYYVDTDFIDGKPISALRFGMKADGVTDNSPMIEKALKAATKNADYNLGLYLFFPRGVYRFSRTINLKSCVILEGESGGALTGIPATEFVFPLGIDGIVVNRYNTNGNNNAVSPSVYAGRADGSYIKMISLRSDAYPLFHSTLDFNNGRVFGLHSANYFSVGDNIEIRKGQTYSPQGGTSVTATATIEKIHISTNYIKTSFSSYGFVNDETITGSTSGATAKVVFVGKNGTAILINSVTGTFQMDEDITGSESGFKSTIEVITDWSFKVPQLTNLTGKVGRSDVWVKADWHGSAIRMIARGSVQDVMITNWAEYGLFITGTGTSGANSNCGDYRNIYINNCNIHGVYVVGYDANANNFYGINSNDCGGFSIYDNSFLGNHYFGCHTSESKGGAYGAFGYNNFSAFVGCYSEGLNYIVGYPIAGSVFSTKVVVMGGDHGAEIYTTLGERMEDSDWLYVSFNGYKMGNSSWGNEKSFANSVTSSRVGGTEFNWNKTLGKNGHGGYGGSIGFSKSVDYYFDERSSDLITIAGLSAKHLEYNDTSYFTFYSKKRGQSFQNIIQTPVAQLSPVVEGGKLVRILVLTSYNNITSEPTITGTGEFAGLEARAIVSNGIIRDVKIIKAPTLNGSLTDTKPIPFLHLSEFGLKPLSPYFALEGGSLILGGKELKSAETQGNSTATDVAGLVNDFNALLAKLKASGLMK